MALIGGEICEFSCDCDCVIIRSAANEATFTRLPNGTLHTTAKSADWDTIARWTGYVHSLFASRRAQIEPFAA